ncbi:Alpha/Beta hydrolase protein [Aspergillus taichungensis]|uniref:Alpha/Beta hydrolase protein n=1 Tax=Aspergillus taichungensis TaxID=482145 RepID=A0A2J5HMH2_9EURO|nr:Alpha/Beta hydrolase protein [Aspergillus taichungensis]
MDFSEYSGPSAEWVALEATLPPPPKQSLEELKTFSNNHREAASAEAMIKEGLHSQVTIKDHAIPARDGHPLEGRSYRPSGIPPSQTLPVFIYLHGGGFLFGTLSSEDAACARIVATLAAAGRPIVVFNLNYRHTPEYPAPVAWTDTEDTFHWVHDHLSEIGGDVDQIVVGGVSAGAMLTVSLALRQNSGADADLARRPRIRGQVLIIPPLVHHTCYDGMLAQMRDPSVSSFVGCRDAPILPVERIKLFMELLGPAPRLEDRRSNPGYATPEEVRGLPPAVFGVAGLDPLRDEGLLFAKLLSENGVPTDVNVFPGLPHGFRRYGDKLSGSKKWDDVITNGIKWVLDKPEPNAFKIKVP